MKLHSLALLLVISASAMAQEAKPSDLTGRFYVHVDDDARIFVNGQNAHSAGGGSSMSKETPLKVGDRLVAHLHDSGGARTFKMIFATTDQKFVVSFSRLNFKIVPDMATIDFTVADWAKWPKYAKADPPPKTEVLPFKNNSDRVWGDKNDSVLACLITPEMIRPIAPVPGAAAANQQPVALTVEAWVDGGSTLIVKRDGLMWINGNYAKPGALHQPTYVNTRAWMPKWGQPTQERGFDRSDVLPLALDSLDVNVELVSNMEKRGVDVVDPSRSPIQIKKRPTEIEVVIPDAQGGARWYKLVFRGRKQ